MQASWRGSALTYADAAAVHVGSTDSLGHSAHDSITLRPCVESDTPFLHEVYAASRAEEMALSGLDAAQQHAFLEMQFKAQSNDYHRRFPGAAFDLILDGERRVGRFYVARSADEIRILDLALLPAERSRGVGTHLLRRLMAEAEKAGTPIRVYIEKHGRAMGLFERVGFRSTEDTGMHVLMEWRRE